MLIFEQFANVMANIFAVRVKSKFQLVRAAVRRNHSQSVTNNQCMVYCVLQPKVRLVHAWKIRQKNTVQNN